MTLQKPIQCPLCGLSAISAPARPGGGTQRPGVRAIRCTGGSCTNYVIATALIGEIPSKVGVKLSKLARTAFEKSEDAVLEVTPELVQELEAKS